MKREREYDELDDNNVPSNNKKRLNYEEKIKRVLFPLRNASFVDEMYFDEDSIEQYLNDFRCYNQILPDGPDGRRAFFERIKPMMYVWGYANYRYDHEGHSFEDLAHTNGAYEVVRYTDVFNWMIKTYIENIQHPEGLEQFVWNEVRSKISLINDLSDLSQTKVNVIKHMLLDWYSDDKLYEMLNRIQRSKPNSWIEYCLKYTVISIALIIHGSYKLAYQLMKRTYTVIKHCFPKGGFKKKRLLKSKSRQKRKRTIKRTCRRTHNRRRTRNRSTCRRT